MADEIQKDPVAPEPQPTSAPLVQGPLEYVKTIFNQARELKYQRDLQTASAGEAERMQAQKTLDENLPRLQKLRTLQKRIMEGDLKDNPEAQAELPNVSSVLSQLATELEGPASIIKPTYTESMRKQLEKSFESLGKIQSNPLASPVEKKDADTSMKMLEKFSLWNLRCRSNT